MFFMTINDLHENIILQVLYGETPCNPNMTLLDFEEFGKLGASLGDNVITMVDGTYGSPVCQQAIKYGIDISIHSWYA